MSSRPTATSSSFLPIRLLMDSSSFWASYDLWRDAVIVATLSAVLCSFVGVFIVLKRIVFVSAALSQMSGVGIALAFYLASVFGVAPHDAPRWLDPLWYSL